MREAASLFNIWLICEGCNRCLFFTCVKQLVKTHRSFLNGYQSMFEQNRLNMSKIWYHSFIKVKFSVSMPQRLMGAVRLSPRAFLTSTWEESYWQFLLQGKEYPIIDWILSEHQNHSRSYREEKNLLHL